MGAVFLILDLFVSYIENSLCDRYSLFDSKLGKKRNFLNYNSILSICLHSINILTLNFTLFHLIKSIIFKNEKKSKTNLTKINNIDDLITLSECENLFFTSHDLKYCKSLFKNKKRNEIKERNYLNLDNKYFELNLFYKKLINNLENYLKLIYDRECYFRYSLRFIYTQLMCLFCNIYLFVFSFYNIGSYLKIFIFESKFTEENLILLLKNSNSSFNITSGILYCKLLSKSICSENGIFFNYEPKMEIDFYFFIWITYIIYIFIPIMIFFYNFFQNFPQYKHDFLSICKGNDPFGLKNSYSNFDIAVSFINLI
jgi:hypothetical protein